MPQKRSPVRPGDPKATFPWVGRIVPWSAALRDKPYPNPRGSYQGILADIPRDCRLTVIRGEGAWLCVEVLLRGKTLKGYVSAELIEYVAPQLDATPEKLAQYRTAKAGRDWPGAAKLLNDFKTADVLVLLKELSATDLAYMKLGALRAMPTLHLRITTPIDSLNPFAGAVGTKLAASHQKLDAAQERFHVDVVSRKDWGARAPIKSRGWDEYPKNAPLPLYRIVVHHTADPLNQTVKQLQDKEMDDAKYSDMPYHFVITSDGKVNEGRAIDVVGAHAGLIEGNKDIKKDPDYGSIGIVLTGDFEKRAKNYWTPDKPTAHQLASLQRLLNHLVQKYNIDPANILKHREVSRGGAETVCPGAILIPHVDGCKLTVQVALKVLAAAEQELEAAEAEAAKLK